MCDVFCHTETFTRLTGVNDVLCMTDEFDEHSLHVHFSLHNSRNVKIAIIVSICTLHFIILHPSSHHNPSAMLISHNIRYVFMPGFCFQIECWPIGRIFLSSQSTYIFHITDCESLSSVKGWMSFITCITFTPSDIVFSNCADLFTPIFTSKGHSIPLINSTWQRLVKRDRQTPLNPAAWN